MSRALIVATRFLIDLEHWITTDRRVAQKLVRLMLEIDRDPFTGTGKPELLKHNFQGCWSRRLTDSHRMVYTVEEEGVEFLSARFHYA